MFLYARRALSLLAELAHPVAQRRVIDAELLGACTDVAARRFDQRDRFGLELGRELPTVPPHTDSLPGPERPMIRCPSKRDNPSCACVAVTVVALAFAALVVPDRGSVEGSTTA